MARTTITVIDAVTKFPLPDALIFINGVSVAGSNSLGQYTTVLSAPTISLTVKFTGYASYNSPTAPTGTAILVALQPIASNNTTSFTLTIYPEEAANGTPLVFSNSGAPVDANYSIGGITVPNLTIGSQTIIGLVAGFDPVDSTFDLAQTTNGIIWMQAITDDGTQKSNSPQSPSDPDTSTMLPALVAEELPEFIAPNTGQGTYFTMTQARMYIGNLFIDELNNIQFTSQDNKIPVYGYASRFYDITAQGKSLVQGQFSVNFISEGYLITVLNEYQYQIIQDALPVDPTATQQQARLLTLVNKLQNPDPSWTPTMIAAAKDEIKNLAAALGPGALKNANANIAVASKKQVNSILG